MKELESLQSKIFTMIDYELRSFRRLNSSENESKVLFLSNLIIK
jgi:hypothetical protein